MNEAMPNRLPPKPLVEVAGVGAEGWPLADPRKTTEGWLPLRGFSTRSG